MMQPPPFVGGSPSPMGTAPAGSATSSGAPVASGTASDTSSEVAAGASPDDAAKRAKVEAGEQVADAPGGAPPSGLNLPDAYTDGQRVWLRQDLIMSTTQVMQAPSGAAAPQMQPPQQMLALTAPAPAAAHAPVPGANSPTEAAGE